MPPQRPTPCCTVYGAPSIAPSVAQFTCITHGQQSVLLILPGFLLQVVFATGTLAFGIHMWVAAD